MTPAMLKSKGGDSCSPAMLVAVKGGGAALCHFFMLRQRLRRVLLPRLDQAKRFRQPLYRRGGEKDCVTLREGIIIFFLLTLIRARRRSSSSSSWRDSLSISIHLWPGIGMPRRGMGFSGSSTVLHTQFCTKPRAYSRHFRTTPSPSSTAGRRASGWVKCRAGGRFLSNFCEHMLPFKGAACDWRRWREREGDNYWYCGYCGGRCCGCCCCSGGGGCWCCCCGSGCCSCCGGCCCCCCCCRCRCSISRS